MLARLLLAGSLCLAAVSAACPPAGSTTATPASSPDGRAAPEDLSVRMAEHFNEVSAIKDAIIDGDLETAQQTAGALQEREQNTERPMDWRPHVSDLLTAAAALQRASDLPTAARATADLGSGCGSCHQAVGAKPAFDHELPPEEDDDAVARMRRHQWGVDRMWEGLIGPSQDAWRWGAETISETPGCDDERGGGDEYLDALCERLEALGRSALDARDASDRTIIYGEFLGTCSGCHTRVDAAPPME